jgi:hypothetical protein
VTSGHSQAEAFALAKKAAILGGWCGLGGVNRQKRRNRGISSTPQYAYSRLKSGNKPAAMCPLTGWEAKL